MICWRVAAGTSISEASMRRPIVRGCSASKTSTRWSTRPSSRPSSQSIRRLLRMRCSVRWGRTLPVGSSWRRGSRRSLRRWSAVRGRWWSRGWGISSPISKASVVASKAKTSSSGPPYKLWMISLLQRSHRRMALRGDYTRRFRQKGPNSLQNSLKENEKTKNWSTVWSNSKRRLTCCGLISRKKIRNWEQSAIKLLNLKAITSSWPKE